MKKGEDYPGVTIVFACHDGNGNFLFARRSVNARDEHGMWDPGAGGLDVHDTVENTLHKEIREEYCTRVISAQFLGYRDVHREHNGVRTHWIALDHKVHIDRSSVHNGEPHKADEIGWFRLDALPCPMHSQWPHFFKRYKSELEK